MEGELGRLGHRTHEHEQTESQGSPAWNRAITDRSTEAISNPLEIKASRGPEQTKDSKEQSEITNPVHDKGLLGCMGGTIPVVPEAHE